jgi:hypothetical protein
MRIAAWAAVAVLAATISCQSSDVSRAVGARCDTNAECDTKCLQPSGDWPGGFCTLLCDDSSGCPSDARCIDEEGGVCAFTCTDDPSCAFLGTGYACKAIDSKGAGAKVMVCRGG